MRVSLANKPLGILVESPVLWDWLNDSVHKVLALQLWRPEFNPPNPHKRPVWRHALVIPELERGSLASLPGHLGKFQANERPCLKQGGWHSGRWHLRCPLDSMWTYACCPRMLSSTVMKLWPTAPWGSSLRQPNTADPVGGGVGEPAPKLWARENCPHYLPVLRQHKLGSDAPTPPTLPINTWGRWKGWPWGHNYCLRTNPTMGDFSSFFASLH